MSPSSDWSNVIHSDGGDYFENIIKYRRAWGVKDYTNPCPVLSILQQFFLQRIPDSFDIFFIHTS